MLLQPEKMHMHKMTSISLKMVEVVTLSENSFVSCSACNNSYFLLSLGSHVSNRPKTNTDVEDHDIYSMFTMIFIQYLPM